MEFGHQDPNPVAGMSAQEEALKRNTDCVYFLASPLTCKKGNECEYRHSEGARMNPRDCWYWLNGNCLNLKCAFRHPPLEGLFGTTGASAGSSATSQSVSPMQMPVPHPTTGYNANKQTVPCFYFQKGLCLKGDRCPFMHGSQVTGSPAVAQQASKAPAPSPVAESSHTIKKALGVSEKSTSLQLPHANVKLEGTTKSNKTVTDEAVTNREIAQKKISTPLYDDLPRSKQINVLPFNENAASRPRLNQLQIPDELLQNGREAGEFLQESSPGFDVLVDNEEEDSDFFPHSDEYRGVVGDSGRHLNSLDEFEYNHASKHDYIPNFDRDIYDEFHDQYGRKHDQYGWEHRKVVSERILERRPREETPDQIDMSDLRHRLMKQRKLNGSRPASSSRRRVENSSRDGRHGEEQRYRVQSHRDQRHLPSKSPVSNRLQGRIILPGRSSPDRTNDLHSEREVDRMNRSRSSPNMPMLYHQGRRNVRSRRTLENSAEIRDSKGEHIKRNGTDALNFAGPKSLAELKGGKTSDGSELTKNNNVPSFKSHIVWEPKTMKPGRNVDQIVDSLSFEGPKPLSEILKRKREGSAGNGTVTSDGDDNGCREIMYQTSSSIIAASIANDYKNVLESDTSAVHTLVNDDNKDDPAPTEVKLIHDGPISVEKRDAVLTEDNGSMIDPMDEEQEEDLDAYDHRDGESEYETGDGVDCKNDDENRELDDEFMDDEDGDDFSSKIGAMLS